MNRYYLIFKGQVQGVGFRYQSKKMAQKCQLTGFVHNLNNGNVEMQIQGEEENITTFLKEIKNSSRYLIIEDYSMKKMNIQEEKEFVIL